MIVIPNAMKKLICLIILVFPELTFAQLAAKALEDDKLELKERYQVMKTNSQTYEDYKVIKEFILDGFWKIAVDTISRKEAQLTEVRKKITDLQAELAAAHQQLAQQKASVEGITFDSEHISVLGVHFGKGMFLVIALVVVAALVTIIVGITARLKMLQASAKDKANVADSLTHEFEEYKRKALERQTKLSRELQNERNKLVELGRG
jgi:preprotein translocase subunit SecF